MAPKGFAARRHCFVGLVSAPSTGAIFFALFDPNKMRLGPIDPDLAETCA
jgi:hypothetical protein